MGKYQEIKLAKRQVEELELYYSKDITYSVSGQEHQKLQIIYPTKTHSNSERVYPGVIYQLVDDTDADTIYNKVPQLVKFSKRGYVVVIVKNCMETDIQSVIDYLHGNAIKYNLAKEYLFVLRDVNKKEELVSLDLRKEVVARLGDTLDNIKAIINVGNKESFKELCEDTNLKLPPVLTLFTAEDSSHQYEWWTEENFDMIEDFISNLI